MIRLQTKYLSEDCLIQYLLSYSWTRIMKHINKYNTLLINDVFSELFEDDDTYNKFLLYAENYYNDIDNKEQYEYIKTLPKYDIMSMLNKTEKLSILNNLKLEFLNALPKKKLLDIIKSLKK